MKDLSALAEDGGVEGVELPHHRFFLATLFQPQVGSVAGQPLHPVTSNFAAAI
jgi:CTP synthase (UTP-ammonia lyase)